ncbi:phage integrase central domain-containing protein [Burkholderia cepacia]
MIVRILQPIWTKWAETARRVRGRIKAILDAEMVSGSVWPSPAADCAGS